MRVVLLLTSDVVLLHYKAGLLELMKITLLTFRHMRAG